MQHVRKIDRQFHAALALFRSSPEDRNEAFEERAAILEFDAGFSRKEAEQLARIVEQSDPRLTPQINNEKWEQYIDDFK